jgi:hypothetical protein
MGPVRPALLLTSRLTIHLHLHRIVDDRNLNVEFDSLDGFFSFSKISRSIPRSARNFSLRVLFAWIEYTSRDRNVELIRVHFAH